MLAENIVKDHHSIMMIGIVETTKEDVEAVNKEEGLNSHQRISDWEKELELLEKWLKAPVGKKEPDEDCKGYAREEEERFQQRNELEIEIELMMDLMRKVSQREKTIERKQSRNKKKTTVDCESIASGSMQHKVWRPGEQQKTIAAIKDRLQNKVWDPGGHRSETHDQEIMIIFNLESLMQEHSAQQYHCILVDIGGLVFPRKLVSYVLN